MNKKQYLDAMGIERWRDKNRTSPTTELAKQQDTWQQLRAEAEQCVACDLCKTRTHVVFGVGDPNADVMIVGEAPGANEDKQGEPFVGRAGQLLMNMLAAIGLSRDKIYITNILKCRPPNNRDPKPEEVVLCTPYLERQIALLQPKIIIAVGRIAAHFLLETKEALGKMRQKEYTYRNIPLLVSYHPAYLLRSPLEKRKALQDLYLVKKYLPS
jgi:DNA polymerase